MPATGSRASPWGPACTTYNPDADYAVAAVYLPTVVSGQTVVAETQTTYTYETTGSVRRHRLTGMSTRNCVGPSADHASCASETALGSTAYTYDANDNVATVAESNDGSPATTRYYCYDALNRLSAVKAGGACTSGPQETYTYDDAGNIATAVGGGLQTTYTYYMTPAVLTPLLRFAQSLTVNHNTAGQTVSIIGGAFPWSFAYDPEGRLASACRATSCSGSGFDRVDYAYDGEGRRTRIKTTTAGGSVTTLDLTYSGSAPAQEITNGVVTRTFVTDETGTITRFCDPDCTGTNPQYLVAWNGHGDALSVSRLDLTTGAATPANRYSYLTWGTPVTATANGYGDLGFRYLYLGSADVQWDNSIGQGLLYMHARTYHPALGRFLQPDPARADGNLYAYAGNSPVSKVDPSGLAYRPPAWRLAWKGIADQHAQLLFIFRLAFAGACLLGGGRLLGGICLGVSSVPIFDDAHLFLVTELWYSSRAVKLVMRYAVRLDDGIRYRWFVSLEQWGTKWLRPTSVSLCIRSIGNGGPGYGMGCGPGTRFHYYSRRAVEVARP